MNQEHDACASYVNDARVDKINEYSDAYEYEPAEEGYVSPANTRSCKVLYMEIEY